MSGSSRSPYTSDGGAKDAVAKTMLQQVWMDGPITQPGRNCLQEWLTDLEKVGEMSVNHY